MATNFFYPWCILSSHGSEQPQIMDPTFLGGICVGTTMEWSQTGDVACPRRPTISLHPAADWLPSSKYLVSSLPFFATDDGFDNIAWRHRSWLRLASPIKGPYHVKTLRRSSFKYWSTTSNIATSAAMVIRLLKHQCSIAFWTFKLLYSTLSKSLYRRRVLVSVKKKEKGPYCCS